MKLIIDIPEDVYTRLFDNGKPTDIADGIVMERAIRKGIPLEKHDEEIIKETVASIWGKPPYTEVLDKIRAELEILYDGDVCAKEHNCDKDVFEIIDKYRK